MPSSKFNPETARSIFVVGDDAQSIYGFRGSKIELILNFEETYPSTKEILLNQNYRSIQPVLDLAEQILTHNPNQKKKDLFTENSPNGEVVYYAARNDKDEAEFIVKKLKKLYVQDNQKLEEVEKKEKTQEVKFQAEETEKSNDPVSNMFDMYMDDDKSFAFSGGSVDAYSNTSWRIADTNWHKVKELDKCAVLYRTHSQSRSIEEIFIKHNLPYKLVSGVKFLDRKEVKDVLAILKFLANGEDKISLARFLPLITTGIGPKTLDKVFLYLQDFDYPLVPRIATMLMSLLEQMQSVWLDNDCLIDMTKDLLKKTGFYTYLKKQYPIKEEYDTRVENVNEIYSWMYEYDQDKSLSLNEKLEKFLNYISLMTNQDDSDDSEGGKISIMTLHQSKGMEYETVFLVGIEDGLLPHQNSLYELGGMEEEVRLAYVGVTRAENNLYLSSADSRIQFGQIQANPLSRIFRPFIDQYCIRER